MTRLELGDVINFPANASCPVVAKLNERFGGFLTGLIQTKADHSSIHSGLIVSSSVRAGKFWTLEAIEKGVYLLERDMSELKDLNVYRHIHMNDDSREVIKSILRKYWNMPYDYNSLLLNALSEFAGIIGLRNQANKLIAKIYDKPHEQICSELVIRIHEEAGMEFENMAEVSTPSDIDRSRYFKILLKNY